MTVVHSPRHLWDPLGVAFLRAPHEACFTAVQFFTVWVLLIHSVPNKTAPGRACAFILAVVVAVGGAYITYVHPRQLTVRTGQAAFAIRGTALHIVVQGSISMRV